MHKGKNTTGRVAAVTGMCNLKSSNTIIISIIETSTATRQSLQHSH